MWQCPFNTLDQNCLEIITSTLNSNIPKFLLKLKTWPQTPENENSTVYLNEGCFWERRGGVSVILCKHSEVLLCTPLITLCSALFTLCTALLTLCLALFTFCTALFTLCPAYYTLCSVLFTLCPALFTLCNALYTLCPALYTHCPALFTLYPALFTLCPALYTLCPTLYTLFPDLFTFCPALFTLCPALFTLCPALFTLCLVILFWIPCSQQAKFLPQCSHFGLVPLPFQFDHCSVLQDPVHKLFVFQASDGHPQLSDASHAAHERHIWVKPAQQQVTIINRSF